MLDSKSLKKKSTSVAIEQNKLNALIANDVSPVRLFTKFCNELEECFKDVIENTLLVTYHGTGEVKILIDPDLFKKIKESGASLSASFESYVDEFLSNLTDESIESVRRRKRHAP